MMLKAVLSFFSDDGSQPALALLFLLSSLVSALEFRGVLSEKLRQKHSKTFLQKSRREYRAEHGSAAAFFRWMYFTGQMGELPRFTCILYMSALHLVIPEAALSVAVMILSGRGTPLPAPLKAGLYICYAAAFLLACFAAYYFLRHFAKHGKDGTRCQGYRKYKKYK